MRGKQTARAKYAGSTTTVRPLKFLNLGGTSGVGTCKLRALFLKQFGSAQVEVDKAVVESLSTPFMIHCVMRCASLQARSSGADVRWCSMLSPSSCRHHQNCALCTAQAIFILQGSSCIGAMCPELRAQSALICCHVPLHRRWSDAKKHALRSGYPHRSA